MHSYETCRKCWGAGEFKRLVVGPVAADSVAADSVAAKPPGTDAHSQHATYTAPPAT